MEIEEVVCWPIDCGEKPHWWESLSQKAKQMFADRVEHLSATDKAVFIYEIETAVCDSKEREDHILCFLPLVCSAGAIDEDDGPGCALMGMCILVMCVVTLIWVATY